MIHYCAFLGPFLHHNDKATVQDIALFFGQLIGIKRTA
jgi:hypothetical protein